MEVMFFHGLNSFLRVIEAGGLMKIMGGVGMMDEGGAAVVLELGEAAVGIVMKF